MHEAGPRSDKHEEEINRRITHEIWTGRIDAVSALDHDHVRLRSDWRFPMSRLAYRPKDDEPLSIDRIDAGLDVAIELLGDNLEQVRVGPFEAALLSGRDRMAMALFSGAHLLDRAGSRSPEQPSCLVAAACLASPELIWSLTDLTERQEWEQPADGQGKSALDRIMGRGGKALIGFLRSVALGGDPDWITALAYSVPAAAWEERWSEWGSGLDALRDRGGEALAAYQSAVLDKKNQQLTSIRRGRRL